MEWEFELDMCLCVVQWLQHGGGVLHHGHPACSASGSTAGQGWGVLGDPGVGAS